MTTTTTTTTTAVPTTMMLSEDPYPTALYLEMATSRMEKSVASETAAAAAVSSSSPTRSRPTRSRTTRKESRKRRRPHDSTILFQFPLPTSSASASASATDTSTSTSNAPHPDHPDWAHFGHLLAALLLCASLAVCSALDAKRQCLQAETDFLVELVDDDTMDTSTVYETAAAVVSRQHHTCAALVQRVVLPTGVGTLAFGLFSYGLCSTADPALPAALILRRLLFLLVSILGLVVVQTYNVAAIMLIPRKLDETEENIYQSLAAVDRFGHVGDNANLYVLS
jgi:hypothetical protein